VPTHREQTTVVVETSADDDYEESELELPGSTMRRRLIEKGIEQPSALLKGRIPLTSLVQTLAVAEYLNFRHAANVLGVSQSSVSTRVKLLEQELGIMLFERLPRGVRLTNAGRRFVEEVAAGVERLDHAVKTAGMLARGEDGLIRVGVHALHPVGFLIDLLNRYRELHPRVDIQITEGATRDTLMQLRAENLDVTFVAGTPVVPDCHSRPMWTEPLVVAIATNHPLAGSEAITWDDLASESFLARQGGMGQQVEDHIVLRLASRWPQPSIQRFDVGRDTLMSMVAQGYGMTLATMDLSHVTFPGVVFRSLLDDTEPIVFSVVWSPNNGSPILRDFLSLANKMKRALPNG
jgi:DNA-binding transcriptional LysR family regulator